MYVKMCRCTICIWCKSLLVQTCATWSFSLGHGCASSAVIREIDAHPAQLCVQKRSIACSCVPGRPNSMVGQPQVIFSLTRTWLINCAARCMSKLAKQRAKRCGGNYAPHLNVGAPRTAEPEKTRLKVSLGDAEIARHY